LRLRNTGFKVEGQQHEPLPPDEKGVGDTRKERKLRAYNNNRARFFLEKCTPFMKFDFLLQETSAACRGASHWGSPLCLI
jgi:hypothetical protein